MEYKDIKQLIDDMGNAKIDELEIEFPEGLKISMKKNANKKVETQIQTSDKINNNIISEEKKDIDSNIVVEGNLIKSPMVGTFYLRPEPNSTPYVEIGKMVKKGDILCIVEAMKLMNEIESEFDGKIVEIFAKDGEPVEYGMPLFRII